MANAFWDTETEVAGSQSNIALKNQEIASSKQSMEVNQFNLDAAKGKMEKESAFESEVAENLKGIDMNNEDDVANKLAPSLAKYGKINELNTLMQRTTQRKREEAQEDKNFVGFIQGVQKEVQQAGVQAGGGEEGWQAAKQVVDTAYKTGAQAFPKQFQKLVDSEHPELGGKGKLDPSMFYPPKNAFPQQVGSTRDIHVEKKGDIKLPDGTELEPGWYTVGMSKSGMKVVNAIPNDAKEMEHQYRQEDIQEKAANRKDTAVDKKRTAVEKIKDTYDSRDTAAVNWAQNEYDKIDKTKGMSDEDKNHAKWNIANTLKLKQDQNIRTYISKMKDYGYTKTGDQSVSDSGGKKVATKDVAKQYLKQAKGDIAKAKQLAAQDGYEVK